MQALTNRVIIERAEPVQSGTVVVRQSDISEGVVIAIGPDVIDVAVGDYVYFDRHAGNKILNAGMHSNTLCMTQDDIWGVRV